MELCNSSMIQKVINNSLITSGYQKIDDLIGGWHNGELVLLCGRPATGKTTFMLSSAVNIASSGIPVALFELEKSTAQLAWSIIQNMCEISYEDILTYTNVKSEIELKAKDIFQQLPLYMDDDCKISVENIRQEVVQLDKNVGIIFIDYLQLIEIGTKMESREQELSFIIKNLKELAIELDIPIIVSSQIPRNIWLDIKDKKPNLSILADFLGDEFENIDTICFFDRTFDYSRQEDLYFMIAKHPSGIENKVNLIFCKQYSRIQNSEI